MDIIRAVNYKKMRTILIGVVFAVICILFSSCTGIGKAILAHMPESEWREHIPDERRRFQPNTITDLEAIYEELRRTRNRGYAIDNSERDPNVRCVGVPVYNSAGKLVAGVSTSGPSATMTDEKLMECANILRDASARMRERIYR